MNVRIFTDGPPSEMEEQTFSDVTCVEVETTHGRFRFQQIKDGRLQVTGLPPDDRRIMASCMITPVSRNVILLTA